MPQSLKGKYFSRGGKEVRNKVIAQGIHNYTMSCFRLPRSLCNDFNKFCANLWWGDSKGFKKAYWVSWKHLCQSKEVGGLNFKDLVAYNQIMLAKLSWRILRNPYCLLSRVLKGRYFKTDDLLNASIGIKPAT